MFDNPQVFVDVDTQRDFLEPDGALYVPNSAAIIPSLRRLTSFARTHQIPVLATACAHALTDPELDHFPPHCLAGSPGQRRIDATAWPETLVIPSDGHFNGEIPPHLTLEKRELDVFSHLCSDPLIALYQARQPLFVIYGVATDYCVKAVVLGLLARRCRVALVVDAVRAIDADAEAGILTDFAQHGVILTLTDVVCDLNRHISA